ncbi:hypothetical protein QBC35DRAFT_450874 [Podospora australis]|uniref:Serine protease n=1 Tax=Podospora australis TaxID=1536484 RepID=A0AAN7AJZ1_9PEZI|nr:hypothetical protein QBC35DRAFT_450874 [Podospora australis]
MTTSTSHTQIAQPGAWKTSAVSALNFFKPEKPSSFIPIAAQHAGAYRGVADGLKCWEVKDPDVTPFREILEAACLKVKPSSPAYFYVMLAGATKRHRKAAIKQLKRGFLLRDYPGLKLDHWDWPPDTSSVTLVGDDEAVPDESTIYRSSKYIIRPARSNTWIDRGGLYSITATNVHHGSDTTQTGTLRCFVMVQGRGFFITPAHIFLPPMDSLNGDDDDTDDSGSDSGCETLRDGSVMRDDVLSLYNPATFFQYGGYMISDTVEEEAGQPGPPSSLASDIDFTIFSPALDYALVPIPETEKFDSFNAFAWLYSTLIGINEGDVKHIESGRTRINAVTPSHGDTGGGGLNGRPVLIRLPYSDRFSKLYPVEFIDPVRKGDCGSVVTDMTARILGFVVAAGAPRKVAYVVSAAEILLDIKEKLGELSPVHVLIRNLSLATTQEQIVRALPALNPPATIDLLQPKNSQLPAVRGAIVTVNSVSKAQMVKKVLEEKPISSQIPSMVDILGWPKSSSYSDNDPFVAEGYPTKPLISHTTINRPEIGSISAPRPPNSVGSFAGKHDSLLRRMKHKRRSDMDKPHRKHGGYSEDPTLKQSNFVDTSALEESDLR